MLIFTASGAPGRVDETGEAFTFITHEDMATVRDIEKVLGKPIERRTLEGFDYKTQSSDKEVRSTASDEEITGYEGRGREEDRSLR